jgi:hypothetical protein
MLGDANSPFRCSKLAALVKCTARVFMMEELIQDDEGGIAAQSGNLTHEGVAAFHIFQGTLEERKKAAWGAIARATGKFPLAEINEVRLFITPYMSDPRNIDAEFIRYGDPPEGRTDNLSIERQLDFTLPPHPIDPTGRPIYMQGTYDQIRKNQRGKINSLKLADLKTGKKTGWEMLHDYAIQQACYVYGAKQTIPELAGLDCAMLMRNHGYRTREKNSNSPDGVFWEMLFLTDAEWVDLVLENARLHVALYRMGEITLGSGPHCTYCEFGGLVNCVPKFQQLSLSRQFPSSFADGN